MKKITLLFALLIVYGEGVLFAQGKYQPKYLREDNKEFKNLTEKSTDNGWIEFKKEAKVSHNNFFKNYASSLGLDKDYDFKSKLNLF
jgi:hypothetical protein